MIDLDNYIIHEILRKTPRYPGEVDKERRYACYCENCNKLRGYIKKSHYKKKSKLCVKCRCNITEYKEQARQKTLEYNKKNPPKRCPIKAFNNKLRGNLRNRLNRALKNNYKAGSAVSDLGCSIPELKKYLESKFQPNMTWSNHSKIGWHIDHIKPLSKFNLSNREELLKAVHYSNLQPLWAQIES